jgi:glycosyltransferase involved in cell wall biosynthesis
MDPAGGGVAQAIETIALGLSDEGFHNEVVSVDDPTSPFLELEREIPIHALGPGRYGWAYAKRLRRWLESKGQSFDLWIVHGLWLYPSAVAVSLGRKHDKPVHIYPHGMLDPWFQNWKLRPIKTLRNILYWHFVESATIRRATSLLFTCEEEQRLAATTFSRYDPRVEAVVGLGHSDVPTDSSGLANAFAAKCPEVKDRSYLLFMGRLHPKKGIDLLIKAWAAATTGRSPGSLPLLVFAGPDPKSPYGQSLRKLAESVLPSGSYLFPGMITGAAKWDALRGASAFALFSHQENFGIAVVEALACGTPVLLSDKVNIWREIVERGGGWAASDSVESVTECLNTWLDLAPEIRDRARQCARATFLDLYEARQAARSLASHLSVYAN